MRRGCGWLPSLVGVIVVIVALVLLSRGQDADGDIESGQPGAYTARSGVSFRYPAAWVLDEVEGRVTVATSTRALEAVAPQPGDFSATVFPPFPASMLANSNLTTDSVLANIVQARGDIIAQSETSEITVNGHRALRASFQTAASEGFALAIELPDGSVIPFVAEGAPGSLAEFEAEALEIAGSIEPAQVEPTSTPEPTGTPVSQ